MNTFGKIFILGDSYSTFKGYNPDTYDLPNFYPRESGNDGDVEQVSQTWWHKLCTDTNSEIILNSSYSGTTVSNSGYDGEDYSNVSFVTRLDALIESEFFKTNNPDTIFVFGGTNDSWANAPVGELMYSDWAKDDLYSFLPAYCYLLNRLKESLPDARVICIINSDLKECISAGIQSACKNYGCEYVELYDICKTDEHPNIKGMCMIEEQILNNCFNK